MLKKQTVKNREIILPNGIKVIFPLTDSEYKFAIDYIDNRKRLFDLIYCYNPKLVNKR